MSGQLPDAPPEAISRCRNCDAERQGLYCSQCGERFPDPRDLSLRHLLLREIPRELTDIDGKLLTSLRLLVTRPGFLAAEYVAGRRTRYIGPLRLLLVVFVLHAFALAVWPGAKLSLPERAAQVDPTGVVVRLARARAPAAYWDSAPVRAAADERTHWVGEVGTVLIALIVAAIQQVMFRRPPRRYLEHAALALSATTFFLLVVGVVELFLDLLHAREFGPLDQAFRQIGGGIVFVVYWFLAIRRFYGTGPAKAIAATLIIYIIQAVVAIALNVGVLAGQALTAGG